MNILTSQQKRVLNGIKYFSAEYHGGVPYKILKLDLDTTEEDLNPILEYLEKGNYISLQDGVILLEENRGSGEGGAVQGETQLKEIPIVDSSKVTVEDTSSPDSDQWAMDNALTSNTEDMGIGTPDVEKRDDNDQPAVGVETPEGIVEIEKVLPKEGEAKLSNDKDDELTDAHEEAVEVELEEQFSEKELKAMELIQKLVDESGNISRTLLEGTFLYGELELSSIGMYNLVTSLENKGIIKKIKLTDGEYYRFTP